LFSAISVCGLTERSSRPRAARRLNFGVRRHEIRPRPDKRGVDLVSAVLPFGRLWYGEPGAVSNAIGYATFFNRSHNAVIRVYDEAGNVIYMHGQAGDFREP
jgi:hypothetical protein